MYTIAMTGATTCATLAIRFTPPIITSANNNATAAPTTHVGMPKEREKPRAMLLPWMGGRNNPQATAASTANNAPKNGERSPFSI